MMGTIQKLVESRSKLDMNTLGHGRESKVLLNIIVEEMNEYKIPKLMANAKADLRIAVDIIQKLLERVN